MENTILKYEIIVKRLSKGAKTYLIFIFLTLLLASGTFFIETNDKSSTVLSVIAVSLLFIIIFLVFVFRFGQKNFRTIGELVLKKDSISIIANGIEQNHLISKMEKSLFSISGYYSENKFEGGRYFMHNGINSLKFEYENKKIKVLFFLETKKQKDTILQYVLNYKK